MTNKWHIRLLIGTLLLSAGLGWPRRSVAQEPPSNLLRNSSLETPYYGQGAQTRTVPNGWSLWVGRGEPNALPHNDPLQVLEGAVAWGIKQSGAAFTAAGYQQVAVNPGDNLRASAWGWVFTCNDAINSCAIPEPPYHRSDPTAGAALRVGIDPTGGLDPTATSVIWSAALAPYDQWVEMSVSAAAQSSTVTVFLYMTQTQGLVLNEVYWDRVSLVTVAEGAAETDTGGEVPYVVPQGVRPDGSIVHVVQTGDTLWSIAYAYVDYNATVDSIAALNGLKTNTRILQPGQELQILPPGSVDPRTGQPVTPGAPAASTQPLLTAVPTGTARPVTTPTIEPEAVSAQVTRDTQPLPLGGAPRSATPEASLSSTPAPTDTPAPTATATLASTATPTQMPSPEPSATAQEVAALVNTAGTLCASVYDDRNQNALHDPDEPALAGSQIVLAGAGGDETYPYGDADEPLCLELPAGQYRVSASAPAGYGLTTVDSVIIGLVSGRRVEVAFGGAEGYSLPPAPEAPDTDVEVIASGAIAPVIEDSEPTSDEAGNSILDQLYEQSGLVVLGVAAVIALGGVGLLLITRRAR